MYEQAQQLTIHVESNAEWEVSKENEADDTWYHFEKTSFNGSADIVINVDAHEGSSVRTGIIVLSTKAAEGATPLMKTIKIKQANPQRPVVTEVKSTSSLVATVQVVLPSAFFLGSTVTFLPAATFVVA